MSEPFHARSGLILIKAEVAGPTGKAVATLVLDTGATSTSLHRDVLRSIGYEPDAATDFASVATGTRIETAPRLVVNRLGALGRHAIGLRVVAHNLPPEAAVDGLLGLDFFRDTVLTLDFRAGEITVA